MKFNIEIDLDDLISDMNEEGDCDLNSYIKHEVIRTASNKLLAVVQERSEESIFKKVNEIADSMVENVVNSSLNKALAGGKLKRRGREEISIDEYILESFNNHSGWNNPEKYIAEKAKEFSQDMKNRVDAIFATKIVMNMQEQGLLKDGVSEMLIGNN